jgi:peptidoglycan/LPS O-acetylase OafA/YrhL
MKTYRPDIDGLRGIAVLSVVLFHGGFSTFSGGYVGVDVFFVISGFLITNIILREFDQQQYSTIRFYERRIRRIFPALFTTLILTMSIGALLFIPSEFKNLAESAVAVTLFASNALFRKQSGYFDAPAENKPLLHTWSLAVEEQFYIAFPLVLIGIRRFLGARYVVCLGVLASVSLGLSVYGTYNHPLATFYLAPTRSWELLIGALLACGIQTPAMSVRSRNLVGAAGLLLIGFSIFVFDSKTLFPLSAVLPTLGAALVIDTGRHRSGMGWVLSNKPLVFLGWISYSLYLLHWPLIVIAKKLAIVELTKYQMTCILALAVGLAAFSWYFVERPFRAKHIVNRWPLFPMAGAFMLCAVATGLYIVHTGGLPQRFKGNTFLDSELTDSTWVPCYGRSPDKSEGLCKVGHVDAEPSFLLWGDSHAAALAPALNLSAESNSAGGFLATRPGCPALLSIERQGHDCGEFSQSVIQHLESHKELKTVILVSRWSAYAFGRYKAERGDEFRLRYTGNSEESENSRMIDEGLKRTVAKLLTMNRQIVLVRPVPEVGYEVPSAYAVASITGRDIDALIAPTRREYDARNEFVLRLFDSLVNLYSVRTVDVTKGLCDNTRCRVTDAGRTLYSDNNHLSRYGALITSASFDQIFLKPNQTF